MGGLCDCFTHTNPLLKTDLLKVNLMCYAQCSRQQNTYAVFILQLGVGEIHLGRKVLLQYTTTVRNSDARSVQKPCWLMNVDDFSGDYTNHDSMIFINFRRMGKSRSRDHRGIPFSTKRGVFEDGSHGVCHGLRQTWWIRKIQKNPRQVSWCWWVDAPRPLSNFRGGDVLLQPAGFLFRKRCNVALWLC